MRYEIDEDNAVLIYEDGSDTPFMFQPDWPDTTPWASREEAEEYAQKKILELTDPNAPIVASGPGLPDTPKPTESEKMAATLRATTGLTPEELKTLLGL